MPITEPAVTVTDSEHARSEGSRPAELSGSSALFSEPARWRSGEVDAAESAPGRTIAARLVPYGVASTVNDGDGPYRETWAPGSLEPVEPVAVYAWHDPATGTRGPLIGRARNISHRDDGAVADLVIAETPAGDEALALVRAGVVEGVSVEWHPAPGGDRWDTARRAVTRVRGLVSGVALALRPAHGQALVLNVRSQTERSSTMTDTDPDVPVDDDDNGDDDDDTASRALAATASLRSLGAPSSTPAAPSPSRWRTFGEWQLARMRGEVPAAEAMRTRQLLVRALADQTTANLTGLTPGTWVRDVVALMAPSTTMVDAFGSFTIGAGMTVNVPVVKQYPDVDMMTAEKGTVPSRLTIVEPESFPVKTFAGGQDVSVEAINLTDPPYVNLLMELFAVEAANKLGAWGAETILQGITTNTTAWPVDVKTFPTVLAQAVVAIASVTHRFPEVFVLSLDAWGALAALVDESGRPVYPALDPSNPAGTVDLTTPSGDVRGITYVVDTHVPGTWALVGLREAAQFGRGPLGTLAADVPSRAGRDIAVYQFAAGGVTDERGLYRIGAAPVALAARRGAKVDK